MALFLQKNTKLQEFQMKMFDVWNCYLPFIKNYRQDFLTFMKTAQYIDNGKVSFYNRPLCFYYCVSLFQKYGNGVFTAVRLIHSL